MHDEEHFRGKTCVVTGAASGIGFAVTAALLEAGAVVFMADLDTETLSSAVDQLGAHAGRVHSMSIDVTNQQQVRQLIDNAASRHGRLDFLFNNAGVGATFPIEQATLEHWRRIIDLNLWGVIYGIDAALPVMRRQGTGHIVNTASFAGLIPVPFQVLYCTTKAAVIAMSESLRIELGDEDIHVSVVCPGNVVSRIWGTTILGQRVDVKPPDDAIPAEEAARIILAGVADRQGIIALPEEIRLIWQRYWASPEESERKLRELARQRRSAFQSAGSIAVAFS
jgi:NAD(P)-dependent dehydrogenase (short-subunit alcohol dehydrogenase family)